MQKDTLSEKTKCVEQINSKAVEITKTVTQGFLCNLGGIHLWSTYLDYQTDFYGAEILEDFSTLI